MKRKADEETQPTPYPNDERLFTLRSNAPLDNEADIEDGTTDKEIPSFLANLPLGVLQRLEKKVSTNKGARDFIDKVMPKLFERCNMPHETILQKVEEIKALYYPEDVSLPPVNFPLICAETLYGTLCTRSQVYPFWWMSRKYRLQYV